MNKAWQHFLTITHHRHLVIAGCFKVGLYKQGLLHDLSKYNPIEFRIGAKYFQGNMSPNNVERKEVGYSTAWLHHKGRNKHHMEYWIDYGLGPDHTMCGMEMPINYVVEMYVDRVAASKNYQKEAYTDQSGWIYYERGKDHYLLHPKTRELLERLLKMLAEHGEDYTNDYIRREVLHNKK